MSTNSQDAARKIGGNVFELCLIMSVRVRELRAGAMPKVQARGAGPSVTAMMEIEQGKIGREYLAKVKHRQRPR